jgi:excisionase family DNA binding protein
MAPRDRASVRINTKTVYSLAQRGELRTFRVGRVIRCHYEEVARFMNAGGSGTTPGNALRE